MTDIRATFASQSRGCAKLGSPFMGRLMALCATHLAPGGAVADRVLTWPGDPAPQADNVPLRLAGALHALARAGRGGLAAVYPPHDVPDAALWAAVETALESEAGFILDRLQSPPQTNEVRRAATLIPVLHMLSARFGLPVRLIEIGCSAGLNLRADRFRLVAGGTGLGPEDAALTLAPDWDGPVPAAAAPVIAERTGIDLTPLDPQAEADRLLSYIWPDQPHRITLTQAAIGIASRTPATLVASDAVDWLRGGLRLRDGALTLLFHTIAWQYLTAPARADGDALIAAMGASATDSAPFARFAMEAAGPHADLTLQVWPGGGIIALGRADYHGRWVSWRPGAAEALADGT